MSWLGFELNILRRLKFKSAALPLTGEPHLGNYLKRWDVRVVANDPAQNIMPVGGKKSRQLNPQHLVEIKTHSL